MPDRPHALKPMPTDLPPPKKREVDRMRRGCLGVLIVGGFCGLVVAVIIGRLVWQDGGEFVDRTESAIRDGRSYALDRTDQDCLQETTTRLKRTKGFVDGMPLLGFFRGCAVAAKATAPFCQGVPTPLEIIDSASYQQAQCDALDLGKHVACKPVFNEVQQLCYQRWLDQKFKE